DDHPVVLHGVVSILQSHSDLKVVAACEDGAAAAVAIRQHAPDIAVLDIAMGGLNGLDVLASIRSEGLGTSLVFLTATASNHQLLLGVDQGAMGVLLKDTASQDLVRCIRAVAAGERWLPTDILEPARLRENERKKIADRLTKSLSRREREVMLMVSQSLANKEIGRRLKISEGTVKLHLYNIYQKLGVSNRTALATLALAHRDALSTPV